MGEKKFYGKIFLAFQTANGRERKKKNDYETVDVVVGGDCVGCGFECSKGLRTSDEDQGLKNGPNPRIRVREGKGKGTEFPKTLFFSFHKFLIFQLRRSFDAACVTMTFLSLTD